MPHQTLSLQAHPSQSSPEIEAVTVLIGRDSDNALMLRYRLEGAIDRLAIPAPQKSGRADGLWEHTCFEVFIASAGLPAYHEFNFSPSGKWAHYAFSDYRQRAAWPDSAPVPEISVCFSLAHIELQVSLAAEALPYRAADTDWQLGLSAVIETQEGIRTYWALSHADAVPDFHQRHTFTLNLK